MTKKTIISLLFVAMAAFVSAQDTLRLTLDSCLRYAYGHNTAVLSADLQRQAAVAALEQARMNFTPTLAASASTDMAFFQGTRTTNTSYGAGASWTLFDGLNNVYNLRSSRAEQRRSDMAVEKSRNDVAVQIINTYLEILANRERQQYLADLHESARRQAEEAEARYNAGRLLESDWLLLKANWKRAEADMNNAAFAIENGLQRLRHLVGLADSVCYTVEPLPDLQPEYDDYQVAVDSLPEMKMSRLELEKARYQLKMARGAYLPQLGLNAYASYYDGEHIRTDAGGMLVTSGGVNTTLSLGVTLPILNRGYNRLQVKQARIAIQQAELQMRQVRDDMEQTLDQHRRTLRQARNTMEACQIMHQATQASLQTCQAKYKAGTVTATELLQQQERSLAALNDYLQSKYTYYISDMILRIYLGK
ncbi:MAG: TolC family protein [Bacteroidales bacterium]|nr:TolC family protein [Bacteroidales bacterium]